MADIGCAHGSNKSLPAERPLHQLYCRFAMIANPLGLTQE
jgi:hypothetical protein